MSNMCDTLISTTISATLNPLLSHLRVKVGAAILGYSYSIPWSAAVVTGVAAFALTEISMAGISVLTKPKQITLSLELTSVALTGIISAGMLYKASLLGLLGTASIANIVAFSIFYFLSSSATLLYYHFSIEHPL